MTQVWLNDRLVELADARVSVLDRGLTVGDGVFETMKVVDGVAFALTRHLDRLTRSAEALGIPMPPESLLRDAIATTARANAAEVGSVGRLRLTLTHGPGLLGDPYAGDGEPTLVVTIVRQQPWPSDSVVAISRYRRNERSALTGVKSTSYAENAVALRAAKAAGADEAILLNTSDQVCEGTGSNIFVVLEGRLVTPPLDSGCLNGVTRQLVLHWTDATERPVGAAELAQVSEAFLTSSTRDIHPISRIDGRDLPSPGPHTRAAMAAWERGSARLDP
ncbi:MAG: aminotransferase class IV family protein [Actinobacteria bacterium]|nr:aminotransferase class IV family protein [Actinomycetota bacterium]